MGSNSFNPLYPGDEDISNLEASIREAELYDDTMKMEKEWKKKKGLIEDDDDDFSW